MKKIMSAATIFCAVAVCAILAMPAVAPAEELISYEFGPGKHHETFFLGSSARAFAAPAAFQGQTLEALHIEVKNGSGKGNSRVSSATVSVNGKEILSQKDFSNQMDYSLLSRKIELTDTSSGQIDLEVRVNGSKFSVLTVTVTGIYSDPGPVLDVPWYLDTDGDFIGGSIVGMGTYDTPPPPDDRGIWVPIGGDMDEVVF